MRDFYELLAFCSSSALGCMDEPPIYGPLRLIDCLEQLIRFGQARNIAGDPRLGELADYIEEHKLSCMYDEEEFRETLQAVSLSLLSITEGE
ncbi:MAG: DUF6092 family protein [Oscillibacter sp.]|nr:DUF6092 family protein [Oscillibacter sp.]